MISTNEFSRKDYVVFRVDDTGQLIAVKRTTSKHIYDKLNTYKTFHSLPSDFKVEVVPLASPNMEEKIFLDPNAKYFMSANKLRPVIIPIIKKAKD